MRIQSIMSKKLKLSVPPENESKVKATKLLTSNYHTYLKLIRTKLHNRIQKLDKNDIPSDISNNKENNKRDQSVSVTGKYSDKELEPFQRNTKLMRTYQVGNSKFEVHSPQNIHVESVYAHKQFQTKISEYEEDKNTMRKRIEELEDIFNPQKIFIKELTIELGNSH